MCIYQSLHVSGDYVSIIRRNNCVYATLGTCYSVRMTVWYVGAYAPAYQINILRINILTINCAPCWFYLQDLKKPFSNLHSFTLIYTHSAQHNIHLHTMLSLAHTEATVKFSVWQTALVYKTFRRTIPKHAPSHYL